MFFNKIYLYDVRAQKKALKECPISLEKDFTLTSFASPNDINLVVGNNCGTLALLDKRKDLRVAHKFKPSMASITHVLCESGSDSIATS